MLLVPILAGACLSTDSALSLDPTDANVAGAFALSSINGGPLPVVASVTATQEFDLASDTVAIGSDGTWTEISVYTVILLADGTSSKTVTNIGGTYAIAQQQINFVQSSGGGSVAFAGSVKGNVLTILFGGSQFLYNRSP
ncbi:MAG TPA: hypothetical protein VGH04_08820 [Gemmatimonadaceae bacterium]